MAKRTYQKPAIDEVGSVARHTLANQLSVALDNTFPSGTPANQLTGS